MDDAPRPPGGPVAVAPAPGASPSAPAAMDASATPAPAMRRSLMDRALGRPGRPRRVRPHPYADEASPDRELAMNDRNVTLAWLALASILAAGGLMAAQQWSIHVPGAPSPQQDWEAWTLVPLFAGLGLLGFGMSRKVWAQRLTLGGWLLFAAFWGLTALDFLHKEDADVVNFVFALVGVYFFTYLGYHEWLNLVRRTDNGTLHFLNVATFVAAGAYFLIDKVQWLRVNLIYVVSGHTKWMLDVFGQGDKAGLVFLVDEQDNKSPTTFFYPDYYCEPVRADDVGAYCRDNGIPSTTTYPDAPSNLWESFLQYEPHGWIGDLLNYQNPDGLLIVPVSIILACTALQSIMLFVGLFCGTTATWQRKLKASLAVGAIVYILNLVRNTGIIWFYGQGHASFWMMHNAIGKGGSLAAMILIAFGVFKWFPEFFHALVGVLDLPDRDGPVERYLKFGRRRPTTPPSS